MRKIYLFLILQGFLLLVIGACDTGNVTPGNDLLGYSYFPLESGQFSIYEVEKTTYSITTAPVTVRYQLKDVVDSAFTDLTGEQAFKVIRYSRNNDKLNWKLDSVWTAKRTSTRAIRTENNIAFVKIIFPAKEELTWNGNVLNNRGKDDYVMQNLDKPFQVSGTDFEKTLTVVQENDSNLCTQNKRIEIYSTGIGLIQREDIDLKFVQTNGVCEGGTKINYGTKFIQKLSSYGKE
jgi:hypothetical protein